MCDVSRTEKMAYKRLLCVLAAPVKPPPPFFCRPRMHPRMDGMDGWDGVDG